MGPWYACILGNISRRIRFVDELFSVGASEWELTYDLSD